MICSLWLGFYISLVTNSFILGFYLHLTTIMGFKGLLLSVKNYPMKKTILIVTFLLAAFITGFAQIKSSIQKAYAFVAITLPGNIIADEQGNAMKPPLNISRFIYIETKGKIKPSIECVIYGSESCKVEISAVSDLPENLLINKNGNKKIFLKPAAGNTLWRLDPIFPEGKKVNGEPSLYKKIILKEKKNGKKLKFTIDNEIELEAPASV